MPYLSYWIESDFWTVKMTQIPGLTPRRFSVSASGIKPMILQFKFLFFFFFTMHIKWKNHHFTCVATEQFSCLGWSEVKVTQSCPTLLRPHGLYIACQSPPSMQFSRQEYWHGSHFLLRGIFSTQESNLGLLHCRHTLYCLHHQGRFEWINFPFKFVGQLICTHCFYHLRPYDIKW